MLKEITAHQQGVLKGLDCTMQCCTLPGCHWLDWERNILCCFLSEIVLCIGLGSAPQSVLFWVSPWVSQKFPVFAPWLQVVLGWSIMFGIVACCKPSRRKTWEFVKKTLGLLGPCWWDFLVGPWHSASTCSWKKSNVYSLWKGVPVGHVHLVPTRVADDRWWKMRGTIATATTPSDALLLANGPDPYHDPYISIHLQGIIHTLEPYPKNVAFKQATLVIIQLYLFNRSGSNLLYVTHSSIRPDHREMIHTRFWRHTHITTMTNPRTSKLLGCYTLRMSGHGSCHPCSLLGNIMTPLNLLFNGLCKYDRLKTVLDSMGKTSNEPWTCMEDTQVSGLYIIYIEL